MIGLGERDYREGMRSLAFLVRRSTETEDEALPAEGLVRRNACVKCGYEWSVCVGTPLPGRCPRCKTSLWNDVTLRKHTCWCCGHSWVSRQADPLRCPACRSRLWAEGPRCFVCRDCGRKQLVRESGPDVRCERCGSASMEELPRESRKATAMIPRMKAELSSALSMSRLEAVKYLAGCGMYLEDAEATVRCLCGDQPVEIASDMDLPVGKVLSISACLRRTIWEGMR